MALQSVQAIEGCSLKMKVVSFSQHLGQRLDSWKTTAILVLSPGSPGLSAVWSGLGMEGTDSCPLLCSMGAAPE